MGVISLFFGREAFESKDYVVKTASAKVSTYEAVMAKGITEGSWQGQEA
jgi:hypothetical protein